MYRANSGSVDFKRHSNQRYQTQVEQSNLNNLFSQQTNQFCFFNTHHIVIILPIMASSLSTAVTHSVPCETFNYRETLRRHMNCFKHDDRGSDPRIGGVVAPDLRGVNLVPHHLHPPPPATLTVTPTFSTL